MSAITAAAPAFDYARYPQQPVPACPVCGTANASRATVDRYGYPVGTSVCGCGFGYLNPQLTEDGYRAFYTHAYRPLVMALQQGRALPSGGQRRGEWIARNLALRTPVRPLATACDVGGSHGAVTEGFCRIWPVATMTVIDPNPAELAQAAARGFETLCVPIEAAPALPPQEVVICSQTLDHVRDPLRVLRWLREQTVPGGWLYVDAVNIYRWARVRRTRVRYDWKLDHPNYWTPACLDRAIKAAGWRVRARGAYAHHYAVIAQKEQ